MAMKKISLAAIGILGVMFILMLASSWNDSAIMDELAHIPAGYSYITQRDMRLNPEHPPMLKDLAGLSTLLFVHPHFPLDTTYWRDDVNGQWGQGTKFLYESGNDANRIIFWSRMPFILLTLLLGWILFRWTQKRFESRAALLALTFFAFSPTVLTHARFVTTDIGAAFGFFIGIASLLKFLERPSWRNVLLAGLAFGVAQLLKFSLVLLLPLYGLVIAGWVLTRPFMDARERMRALARMLAKTAVIGVIAMSVIWVVYAFHTWNYPRERQMRDTKFLLGSYGFQPAVNLDLALIRHPLTRPLGQYLLGILMVQQRASGGNTAFFLGEVSGAGSRLYFPLLYILKEPLAFHLMGLIALGAAIAAWRRKKSYALRAWIERHFTEFTALCFIVLYWAVSVKSPLNIGVRHILPTFPFLYILTARGVIQWLETRHPADEPLSWQGTLKNIYHLYIRPVPKYALAALLILWLIADTLLIFPHFMTYYNELAGGPERGYEIAVDSNYDWGQDLRRLADFVQKNHIEKIAVDYFGGGSPAYYLKEKYISWWDKREPEPGWYAISSFFYQESIYKQKPAGTRDYSWLKKFTPITRAGDSIFIYYIPEK